MSEYAPIELPPGVTTREELAAWCEISMRELLKRIAEERLAEILGGEP